MRKENGGIPLKTQSLGSADGFTPAEVSAYYAVRNLKLKKTTTTESRGPCPIHHGKDDNFSVNLQTGQWYCHSTCDRGGGIVKLEMELTGVDARLALTEIHRVVGRSASGNRAVTDSYPNVPPYAWRFLDQKIEVFEKDHQVLCTHRFYYRGADGMLLFVKARFQSPSTEKMFQKYALTPKGGWTTPKKKGLGPLLYNLHLLAGAEEIHLCNGEKAADAGRQKLGLVTTCTPDGEGKWDDSFTMLLKGKRIFVYVDNDPKGKKHGEVIAQNLAGQASELKLIELPGLPPKGDLYDWIEAGGTAVELTGIIKTTPPVNAPEGLTVNRDTPRSKPNASATAFRLGGDAVVYIDPDPDKEPLRICGRLDVAALTRDAKGEGWGRLLRWRDSEGRAHEWAMPMSLLAGDGSECRARLLDGGLFIAPGRKARDLLTVYLQTERPEAQALCVARVGWQGENFVLPAETIGPDGGGTVIFQTPHESEHLLNTAGTLADWRENVGRFCSGNSRLIIAVSCAFAGPLLSLVGAESGGIHFHGATSTGKSTALWVGGSVLGGGGRNGFVQSWRNTETAIEITAELHNDLCLYLDELAQIDARDASNAVYLLGNASGKGRGNRNLGARKRMSWTLLFVSAGEITLADHTQTAGKRTRGGAEVRLLNVDSDAGAGMGLFENIHGAASPEAFSRQLKDATRRYYGTPLRAHLDRIVKHRVDAEKAVRMHQERFLERHQPEGASGEVCRAARRLALIAAAGELATEAGITGWQPGEAIDAAARGLQSWIANRGTIGAVDKEAAISQVRRFIEANGASRFQFVGAIANEKQVVVNRAGYRRKPTGGETEYLVLPETFKSEVCAGFDYRMVVHALADRGFLEFQPPDLTKNVRIAGNRKTIRVFCVKGSILEV